VIEPEKASDTLGLALSDDSGGWRVQRDEQREHLAAKTLVEREVTADCDDVVVGMGATTSTRCFSIARSLTGIQCVMR
jgi:hypothetical protein